MTILSEAFKGGRISRRAAIGAGGVGIAGLAGALLLHRGSDGTSASTTPLTSADEQQLQNGFEKFLLYRIPDFRPPNLRYEIQYPESWKMKGAWGFDGRTVNGYTTEVAIGFSDKSFKECVDEKRQLLKEWAKGMMSDDSANPTIKETSNQSVDGNKALVLDITAPSKTGTDVRIIEYMFAKNGISWSIELAAATSVFQEDFAKFQKMVASFKLLE